MTVICQVGAGVRGRVLVADDPDDGIAVVDTVHAGPLAMMGVEALTAAATTTTDRGEAMTKQMRLNAFSMNCVGHQAQGLWRHPRDRSVEYTSIDYWVELARTLERGCFAALGAFAIDVVIGPWWM